MQMKPDTTTVLKAQKSRWPFVALYTMVAITTFCGIWVFLRTGDFSASSVVVALAGLLTFNALMYFVGTNFKIGQSVEITCEGVWSLSWVKAKKFWVLPRLKRRLFRWTDLQRWEMRGQVIHLFGAQSKVAINTFLFADGNEVVDYINRFTTST
jgi:ABC-type xylose transport system permease subunit